jgi:Zn-finger nucleic acid-binding protein
MSSAAEEVVESGDVCCANCGVAEVDDIKFKDCDGCDLVKYCGDGCQENHREQHSEECKKRVAELHDRKLFRQPERSHLGECPLCFLPMPLDIEKSSFYPCCSTYVCNGCVYADLKSNGSDRCPFCRELTGDGESNKRIMKRVKANDPAALRYMGRRRKRERDYDAAFEYWTKGGIGRCSSALSIRMFISRGGCCCCCGRRLLWEVTPKLDTILLV